MRTGIIEILADTYRQLYVAPHPGGSELYLDIVGKGHEPEGRDLSHFITSEKDSISVEETPAGAVTVITLGNRADFVTFLRIMANRCEPVDIPDTQGASLLDGVINRRKIERHMEAFLDTLGEQEDITKARSEEFRRFTSDKQNYKDTLIVLSIGPYSAVPAAKLGLSDEEWLSLSGTIRKFHECTHFICRKLYPDQIEPVWDELVADAVGITAAFGRFDEDMEKLFLGVEGNSYRQGRLENYADVDTELIEKVSDTLDRFREIIADHPEADPFALAIRLEEKQSKIWI